MQGRGLKQPVPTISLDRNKSPLMQGRGLKQSQALSSVSMPTSPLMQGRGLKQNMPCDCLLRYCVAPHAGAWIETSCNLPYNQGLYVAPHAGAWIETIYQTNR